MIDWVDALCKAWGAHKRRILADPTLGYPEKTTLGRMIEEGAGALSGQFGSRVLVKDAPPEYRAVAMALARMAATHRMERAHAVIEAHYAVVAPIRAKTDALGLTRHQYWRHLEAGQAFIAGSDEAHDLQQRAKRRLQSVRTPAITGA